MQSIEEKIYEVFWDKNIARMINRADLFSFLKQYVNPGLLTRSSKSELVYDLKEYMTPDNLEFIAERMEGFGLLHCLSAFPDVPTRQNCSVCRNSHLKEIHPAYLQNSC